MQLPHQQGGSFHSGSVTNRELTNCARDCAHLLGKLGKTEGMAGMAD